MGDPSRRERCDRCLAVEGGRFGEALSACYPWAIIASYRTYGTDLYVAPFQALRARLTSSSPSGTKSDKSLSEASPRKRRLAY